MEADGSNCPEGSNSTDCLLRTLLQLMNDNRNADDAKTDWDPITFAFTAVIGVIAIIFAVIPIIQTIIAAGKGRRKASSRAIGKWSQKTESHWNWAEWTMEFTAWTPILTESSLYRTTEAKQHEQAKTDMCSWIRGRFDFRTKNIENQPQDASAARWLGLFQKIGLDNMSILDGQKGLRSVVADYLPDDLTAAPAYAQVGLMISATAATAEVRSLIIDKTTNYPMIIGYGFQLELRQHAMLGLVGVYSWYDSAGDANDTEDKTSDPGDNGNDSHLPTLDEIKEALQNSRALVSIRQDCSFRHDDNGKGHNSRTEIRSLFNENLSSIRLAMNNADYIGSKDASCFTLDYRLLREYFVPTASLFLISPPNYAPALFPTAELKHSHPLTPLALNSKYWAKSRLDMSINQDFSNWSGDTPNWHPFPFYWHKMDASEMGSIKRSAKRNFGKFAAQQKNKFAQNRVKALDGVLGHQVILHMCMKLLHDPDKLQWWYAIPDLATRRYLRWLALEQLKELDQWLGKDSHNRDLNIRWPLICNTAIILSRADKVVQQDKFGHWNQQPEPSPKLDLEQDLTEQWEDQSVSKDLQVPQPGADTAYSRHFIALRAIHEMVRSIGPSRETAEALGSDPVAVLYRSHGVLRASLFMPSDDSDDDTEPTTSKHAENRHDIEPTASTLAERRGFDERIKKYERRLQELRNTDFGRKTVDSDDVHRLLVRLQTVLSFHSVTDDPQSKFDSMGFSKVDEATTALDDIIIFRCLVLALLFRTAPDNSEVLASGLWDHVVPIL